jgi:predicted ATPase
VTSRQRLALPGEHVYEVGPLSLPCGAGDAGASDAVRLFFERAAETNPSLPRDEATAAVVAELVRRLDGMPLAIELAAARSSILSPAQILAKLDNRFRLLAGPPGRGGGPGALRRTIEWSFSLLEPHEQATLAQISVFRGGFAPEAVAGVVDLSAFGPGADPLESLAALRDKSLVRARETDDPTVPRYDLYESIRELAAAELARDDGTAGAVRRHAEYYLLVGALWADDIRDRDDAEARACLEREVDNLLAVHAYAIAREPRVAANVETGLRALLAVDPVLSTRGLVDAHGGWLDAGLAAARGLAVAPTLLAAVSTARAALLVRNGRFELATDAFDESLRLALAAGDRVQEARCLMGLALCWASRRDPDRALRLLQAARAPADEVGAPTMLGELDKMTGLAHYAAGDYELAARFFRVGAARAEAAGFSLERAVALHNLGDASARLGHWNDALAALAGSQAIVEKNGLARLGEFNELLLGCVEAQTSKNAAAVARVERVLDAARALGNHWMAVQVAFFLGRAHAALGHDGRARAYLLESLDLARRDDNGAYVRDAEAALRDLDHLPP